MAVGRITGPLLKANLIRNGIDLAFENDLLYLDVTDSDPANHKVGIKTTSPTHELQINGTTRTNNLIVDTRADIADITITGNTISSANTLNLLTTGADSVIYQRQLDVQSLSIFDNVISSNESNANIELRPNGTGRVEIHSDLQVDGDVEVTGDVTIRGASIALGDADTDNVTFSADVASDIIPDANDTYELGSDPALGGKRWNDIWVNRFIVDEVSGTGFTVNGIDLDLRQGNTIFVSKNGDDTNSGTHLNDPVGSIKYATSLVSAGDTIYIYPGTYTEEFPITVPQGVNVKGVSLRSVFVQPTEATRYNDAFLLNGETTIEDITVGNFYSGSNYFPVTSTPTANTIVLQVGTAPQAHTYVSGGLFDVGDSTQANITNAVYDHTTGDLTLTLDANHGKSIGQNILISGLVFSCNGDTRTFPDNGYAFRFATDFEVTSRSPYIKNISVITKGTTADPNDASDPRGFNAGDAGKGAYIDGAYATANSKEASMLFHSATFIVPGVDAITCTNGVRVEWLNSFTYFANRSFYCYDSNGGFAYDGKTKIRLGGTSGTFTAGNTITFTSTDSSTVATATIDSVDGDVIIVDGKFEDLIGFDTTPQSITDGTATASEILNYDLRQFGAEVRMIGSASVYGNFGLVGDGPGVLVYAIGHNLAYIGNGKEVTNDPETVIQANEIVELNDAKIRYNSVDHDGDFRVGDLFFVDQQSGTVNFALNALNIDLTSGITFNTNGSTSFINGERIDIGNYRISGNTIETLAGDVNINAASGEINLQDNVNITGNLDVTGNVTIGGNITIGDEASDTIQFVAGIDSDIIPSIDSTYSLGTQNLRWSNLFANQADIDDVQIQNNYIQTTNSNANLELRANGTGEIYVPSNDVQIDQDLTVDGTTTLGDTNVTGTFTLVGDLNQTGDLTVDGSVTVTQDLDVTGAAQFEEILVDDNFITTTTSNADLELRASGTGIVLIPNNDVEITGDVNITGDITADNIAVSQVINATTFESDDVQITGNTIETTQSNSNLELGTSGTGNVVVNNNAVFEQNLTVNGSSDIDDLTINGTVIQTGDTTQTGNFTLLGEFTNGNILIEDNFIATTESNSNLELRASGTGEILIPDNNVRITNNLFVNGDATLGDTTLTGNVEITGDILQEGTYGITGNVNVGQNLTVTQTAQFEEILIDDNFITTTSSNADLELRANGIGEILIPNNDIVIDNNLRVLGTITSGNITSTGTVTADRFSTGDILIDDNFISTTQSNSNLELRANGTGEVVVPSNDVTLEQNLTVNGNTDLKDTTVTGTITHTGNTNQTGDFTLTGNLTVSGEVAVTSAMQFENIRIAGNVLETTLSNSNLDLRANGSGIIEIPSNDVEITQNLTIGQTLFVRNIDASGTITANSYSTGDILIDDNFITTTTSNSDLELRANGTGSIVTDDFSFTNNVIQTSNDMVLQPGSEHVIINSTGAIKVPTGTNTQRPTVPVAGQMRYNSQLQRFEGYNGTNWIILQGVEDLDGDTKITAELTEGANDGVIRFYSQGSLIADLDANRLNAERLVVDDIAIDDNEISTTTTNANLVFDAQGTGKVRFENFSIKDNVIKNEVSDSITLFQNTNNGYVKFDGTYGFVLPKGTNAERPGVAYREVGMTRFNTEDERVEVFDGTQWVSVAGAAAGLTRAEAEDLAIETVLIFG
jgi:cytoskeletal protein CcmA (bactofilin family)